MTDVFGIYEALWHRAETEGAWVHYYGLEDGRNGYFDPRHPEPWREKRLQPEIAIKRPYYISPSRSPSRERQPGHPQPDIDEELVTLAHEYGHFRSFTGRTPGDVYALYDDAVKRRDEIEAELWASAPKDASLSERNDFVRHALAARLGRDAVDQIIREETTAWEIGAEVLRELGLGGAALERYEQRARTGLHNHRYKLGLDELWPEDLDAGTGIE